MAAWRKSWLLRLTVLLLLCLAWYYAWNPRRGDSGGEISAEKFPKHLATSMAKAEFPKFRGLGRLVDLSSMPWSKAKADLFIETYLHFRRLGMTREEIARDVFQARLPNGAMGHCYPFVCGDAFRAYADVILDNHGNVGAKRFEQTQKGDVICVETGQVHTFASSYLARVKQPFVLITQEPDPAMPQRDQWSRAILESPLLLKWFARNSNPEFANHPKVAIIPLGLQNSPRLTSQMEAILSRNPAPVFNSSEYPSERSLLLLKNFNVHSDVPDRRIISDLFEGAGVHFPKSNARNFYQNVTGSKFVLSPRGKGIDCFRHYESILLQAIPIVQDLSPQLTQSVFNLAPTYVLPWRGRRTRVPTVKELEAFVPNNTLGRSVALAQYWFDIIDKERNLVNRGQILKPFRSWNKAKADIVLKNYVKDLAVNTPRGETAATNYLFESWHGNCFPFICPDLIESYADVSLHHDTPVEKLRHLKNNSIVYLSGDLDGEMLSKASAIQANFSLISHGARAGLCRFNSSESRNLPDMFPPDQQHEPRPFLLINSYDQMNETGEQVEKVFQDTMTISRYRDLLEYFEAVVRSKFVAFLSDRASDSQLLEVILLGAVPLVDQSAQALRGGVFDGAPVFAAGDLRASPPRAEELLRFVPDQSLGRSVVLARYWLDAVEASMA